MLTVRFHKTYLSITFGFLLLIAIYSLIGDNAAISCLIFSTAHELAHLAAMRRNGIEVKGIRLYGGGIKISSEDISLLPVSAQAVIYSAGCVANLVLGAVFFLSGFREAAVVNLCLGVFNLLPIEHFDGGKLLGLYLSEKRTPLRLISAAITFLLCIAVAVGAVVSIDKIPLSLTVVATLIILSELLDT